MKQFTYKSFAHRAVLLVLLMVMGVGRAWADFTPAANIPNAIAKKLKDSNTNLTLDGQNKIIISDSHDLWYGANGAGLSENGGYARFYVTEADGTTPVTISELIIEGRGPVDCGSYGWSLNGPFYDYYQKLTFTLSGDNIANAKFLHVLFSTVGMYGDQEPTITTHYTFTIGDDIVDAFEGELKSTGREDVGYTETITSPETQTSVSLLVTEAWTYCSNPIYARFQVLRGDIPVDLSTETSILTVTGKTTKLPDNGALGCYIYDADGISAADIALTLHAAALKFPKYKVVCYLSSGAEADELEYDDENAKVTKEPNWDVKFTYQFANPVIEIPVDLAIADLLDTKVAIHYYNQADAKLKELSGESSVTSYYNRWYVRHKTTGVRQPVVINDAGTADSWVVQTGYNGSFYVSESNPQGWSVADNMAEKGSINNDGYSEHFGRAQIFMPTSLGDRMLDCSDYEIVLECTDEYTGSTPAVKLRYVFRFPEVGDFEGEANSGATESSSTQTVSDRDAESATLTMGTEAAGAKYARFYVTDAKGTPVAPTSLLTVSYNGTAATACETATNGFFVYDGGNVLDPAKITVTLTAPKAYKTYRVVALYSSALSKMTYVASTMVEEPDYDTRHTYSFDYSVTTHAETKTIEWNATTMAVDASTADLDVDWATSIAELQTGQCVKWWVEDGNGTKQPLAIGTTRQGGTWTVALPAGFAVTSGVATLSGMNTIDEGQLLSWVKTSVSAPSEATYATLANHKIVCEVYTNNSGTGTPNARYTFQLHKGFVGSLKSGATTATERVLLTAGATAHTLSVTLPAGTKYARVYLTDNSGVAEEPTGLSVTGGTAILPTVDGYDAAGGSTMGSYVYNASGLTSPLTVTFNPGSTTVDAHRVVVLTSADAAVVSGSDVTSEPDFDSRTTYWFKYPVAAAKTLEANVEWSAQSMQLASPAIEAAENHGAGYLENNSRHYTLQWYVIDDDGIQNLQAGNSRAIDYWTMHVDGDPFTISGGQAVVVNNASLSTNWNKWTTPVFYAPKNKTMRELAAKNTRFVCRFFEDDETPLDETNLLSMTYTVYIDRTQPEGSLKDGGQRDGETISEGLTMETTTLTLSLANAQQAFVDNVGGTVRYARIYLTKNDGTPIDPAGKLTVPGTTPMTTASLGSYLSGEEGVTLPTNVTLNLEAGKYTFYNVVIAMSGDSGETPHTAAFAPRRAASVATTYEPDYDMIYTIRFADVSPFPGSWIGEDGYKHAKEILVENESVTEVTMPLSESINKIKKEYGASDFATLAANLHVRWFIAKKNDEGKYERIPGSEGFLTPANGNSYGHKTATDQGIYWNALTSGVTTPTESQLLDMKISKPIATESWEDYRVMVYMKYVAADVDESPENVENGDTEDNLTGLASTTQTVSGDVLTHEPDRLDMLYIYNFFVEDDANFQFVHSNGETNWAYLTHDDDARVNAAVQQYFWDNTTGTKEAATEDVRQGVHTVEYNIYVDPTSTTPVALKMPFQDYFGSGNVLEPTAYIRWYDWVTDVNHNRLAKVGTYLEDKVENNKGANVSRGFFLLNNSKNGISPTQSNVGVTFDPNGLTGLVTIACDVSKYYDGIYSCNTLTDTRTDFAGLKKPYLMHEPTLSTRYIFNIRPAAVIADEIQAGQDRLEAKGSDMFQLAEDNGRVAVAMKDGSTSFSIRANLSELDYYYIRNGNSLLQCSKLRWFAYYEDETGLYRKDSQLSAGNEEGRISQLTISTLSGNYNHISSGTAKSVTAAAGQRYHLVGYIGDGTLMAPVVHYEINLQDAPAYIVSELPLERTEAYLRQHMTLQSTIDFDGLSGTPLASTINSQSENHSLLPMSWDEAQYGFCYPDIRRIYASAGNDDYMGISPLHGDYMLLRSMNMPGISETGEHEYTYRWWSTAELYDYTHNFGIGDYAGNYGSFLYVDASDESRTIAQMKFSADLCAGSELCFTGVIANMTDASVQPQVMTTVYALREDGSRTRVVSFHSSDLSTVAASGYTQGKWFQVYGRVAIPTNVDLTGVTDYVVDIDNYAPGTLGADYAVDQLQFYTSNAKLKVRQGPLDCNSDLVKMNVYIDADALRNYAGRNVYWRLCDADGNALSPDLELYEDGNTTLTYGTTAIPDAVPATLTDEATFFNSTTPSGYYQGTDGVVYFSLANKYFNLRQGQQYYVSVYNMSELGTPNDEALWARNTDACSIFSPLFIPKMMYLTMEDTDDNSVMKVNANCSTHEATIDLDVVLNMPDDDEVTGFKKYDGVHFDFFKGTLAEYRSLTLDGNDAVRLEDALKHYRGKAEKRTTPPGTDYQFSTTLDDAYQTVNADYYAVIKQYVDAGRLFLSASSHFDGTVTSASPAISALPIEDQVTNAKSISFNICTPLEFTFDVDDSGNAPTLVLGFEDVTSYPDGLRVVRVGREQLRNMQDGDFLLHIPVNTFKVNDAAEEKTGTLAIVGDLELLRQQGGADQTTDTRVTADINKVATFESTSVSDTQMFIAVNFHGDGVTKPTFYEGFTYRMFLQVRDANDDTACEGNVEFLLKVVPEFVTWRGTSSQWNSDANWRRSERTELYKGPVTNAPTATNHATAGHPDGYKSNGEIGVNVTPSTFVPMKFTYVTIPSGLRAPVLADLSYDGEGIYDDLGTGATANIQYDLLVRYTEQVCQTPGAHGDVSPTAHVYDCEKFYGNWAKELYLKPRAELLNQQWLTYEKVWVEKELQSNTWTLMATPLQNTYAGDMYVPVSDTPADNGRQLTEAFQPISFSTTPDAAGFSYSRTKYPFYQKGWTQQGVYVKTQLNDVRATKYSANIPGGVSTLLTQWSHSYNDVTVPYSTWTAFAIRPHKKSQTATTLLRLPKADTSYDYYRWDNTPAAAGSQLTETVSKPTTGKLLTDGTANIAGVTYGTTYGITAPTAGDGSYQAAVSDIQSSPSDYQLVGNPYLCTIDMKKFLEGNSSNLETGTGYWTYTNNNTGSPLTTGYIAPMQSFFVKVKGNATGVVFTPTMMVDGATVTPAPSRDLQVVTLQARNDRGSSEAAIVIDDDTADSQPTLFDSNLSDVPMVYTVDAGQAVTVNRLPALQSVPFGVTCSSDARVTVTIDGSLYDFGTAALSVVDALTGAVTPIDERTAVTVQPNDYGRYFLTADGSDITSAAALTSALMVSVRQGTVTVTAPRPIGRLTIVSLAGVTVSDQSGCGSTVTTTLPAGTYVVTTDGPAGSSTQKIIVR